MPTESQMAFNLPAGSRSFRDTRPRAAVDQRPSGRSRSPRIDPSTITSPAHGPWTQISPGARGAIEPTTPHNHSPPDFAEARVQISGSAAILGSESAPRPWSPFFPSRAGKQNTMTPAAIAVLVVGAIGWIGLVKVLAVEPIALMARERRARRR